VKFTDRYLFPECVIRSNIPMLRNACSALVQPQRIQQMPSFSASMRSAHIATTLCFVISTGPAAAANSQCDNEVRARQGESLSGLAERCGVTEARILDLNPKVQGTKDLQAGMVLKLAAPSAADTATDAREAAESLFARLKSYAQEAGQSIEGAAETITQSVEDFVKQNPDLHLRVRKLGHSLSIPGMERAEAQISLSRRKGTPDTPVTLSAIGLPTTQRVDIAGGEPGSNYTILDSALTSAEGTLQVTLVVPRWADPQRDFIFVIAGPTIDIALRSAVFDVLEPEVRK